MKYSISFTISHGNKGIEYGYANIDATERNITTTGLFENASLSDIAQLFALLKRMSVEKNEFNLEGYKKAEGINVSE